MDFEERNKAYSDLCRRFGTPVEIRTFEDGDAPTFTIERKGQVSLVAINTEKVQDGEYDGYAAYAVRQILLPRLVLKTRRLTIRRFQLQDAEACFEILSDQKGSYMDCCKPFLEMNEAYMELMKLFSQREGQYVMALNESGKVVGMLHVFDDASRAVETKEIGYSVSPAYQRQGYAFEALTALLHLLQYELHVELVVAGVLAENTASIKLLEKLGFSREGLRRKCIWHEGLNRPVDLMYYYRDR